MGSMSSLRIFRTDQLVDAFEFSSETNVVPPKMLERLGEIFTNFQQEQELLQESLSTSISSLCLNASNKNAIGYLQSRFKLPITKQHFLTIVKIAAYIKTTPYFSTHKIHRFKIQDFCSISLESSTKEPSLDDTLIIHFKKKTNSTIFGVGARVKTFKALHVSKEVISWVAEKTMKKGNHLDQNSHTLNLDPKLFVNPPLYFYPYIQEKTVDDFCEVHNKTCTIEKLYDTSLIDLLEVHQNVSFLQEKSIWQITLQLIAIVKELHKKNMIFRDLKPDNILVLFDKKDHTCSLDQLTLLATDLETVINEADATQQWIGSPFYYPKDTVHEKQGKPYDIYVLGRILSGLFRQNLEEKDYLVSVRSMIQQMIDENFSKRPVIDDIEQFFLSKQPKPLTLTEKMAVCVDEEGCNIL